MAIHVPNTQSNVGERLQIARDRAGYNTASVASKALGVKFSTYAAHENGGRGLTAIAAVKYAKAFDVSLDWLLTGAIKLATPDATDILSTASQPKLSELQEYIEEISDLLHAIDKIGDGIGGADGYAVSAVALNAKSFAENALGIVRVHAREGP